MARPARRPPPVPGAYEIDTGTVDLSEQQGPPRHWLISVNGVPSSTACPDDPSWLGFEYLQIMAAAIDVLTDRPDVRVVHLGAGGCALPWALHTARPRSRHLAIDLDATLIRLVREWFELPRSPALRLRPGDARAELTGLPDGAADVIVRDVFAGDTTPGPLRTAEFVQQVRRALAPGGHYLANIADRPPLRDLWNEVATTATVFEQVVVVAETSVLRGRRYGNAVLIASDEPLPVSQLHRALLPTGLSLRVCQGPELRRAAVSGRVLRD